MKTVVIYDSKFGNTKQISEAIAEGLKSGSECDVFHLKEIDIASLGKYDLIIIGSPTRGFKATPDLNAFLKSIPNKSLNGISIAGFDTRILLSAIDSKALRWIVKTGGYAAKPIDKRLQNKGGVSISSPMGFYVTDEEGPLKENEIERAEKWGFDLLSR